MKEQPTPASAEERKDLWDLLYKKVNALRLEVDSSIADDIKKTLDDLYIAAQLQSAPIAVSAVNILKKHTSKQLLWTYSQFDSYKGCVIAAMEEYAAQSAPKVVGEKLYKWANYHYEKPDKQGEYIVDRKGAILKIVFSETKDSPINEMWEGVIKWLKPVEYAAQPKAIPVSDDWQKHFEKWSNTVGAGHYMAPGLRDAVIAWFEANSNAAQLQSAPVNTEELWDEFSEHIDEDIDSLSMVAGRTILTRENYKKLVAKYAAQSAPKQSAGVWDWISVEDELPKRHTNVWCYNRDGRQFEGRICYGMHKPFFTYPHGDGNPSNTAPDWIDVTHWRDLPEQP